MNWGLLDPWVRMALHRNCLFSIVCIDIFKDFILRKRSSFFWKSCKPKSWGLCVQIICDAQVVFPSRYNFDITASLGFLLLGSRLSKHVIIPITEIIDIKYLIILFSCSCSFDDLLLRITFSLIINIKNLLFFLVAFFLRVLCFDPAIIEVNLKIISIILMEFLQLLNPFLTWHSFGNQVLLIFWKIFIH